MKTRTITIVAAAALFATAAVADEIHDKTATVDRDLKEAIGLMNVMSMEHGPDFGGHFGRAEQLARAADREREAGMQYYRARHPGWQ